MKNFLKKIADLSSVVRNKREKITEKTPVSESFSGLTKITKSQNKLGQSTTYYDFSKHAEAKKAIDLERAKQREIQKAQAEEMINTLLGVVGEKIESDKIKADTEKELQEGKVVPEETKEPEVIHVAIEKI